MTKIAALLAVSMLGLNTYIFYFTGSAEHLPARHMFAELPVAFGDWKCPRREVMAEKIEKRLGVTDYLLCDYQRAPDESPVNIYVGYHQRQVREGAKSAAESAIHPPRHCLPGSGWNIIHSEVMPLGAKGIEGVTANRLIIAHGDRRQVVYYWYQERGRVIASDYWKIVYLFWDRARRSRSDGALVRFTTEFTRSGEDLADARIRDLASAFLPHLSDYVPD